MNPATAIFSAYLIITEVIVTAKFNLGRIADDLFGIWMKRVYPSDSYQRTASSLESQLVAILGWLIQAFTQNVMPLTAPIHKSFPYNKECVNEWFSVSAPDTRPKEVNIINVDKRGEKSKCFTNDTGKFPETSVDYKVFFHGTSHESANNIIKDGIDLAKGKAKKDFSDGRGFYLADRFEEVWPNATWARNRPHCTAVLVFRVRITELRRNRNRNGLDLEGNIDQWKEVVSKFRTGSADGRFLANLENYDFIEGPLCGEGQNFRNPTPSSTYQLCVHSDDCARLFDQSLHSVVFFERR